MAGLFKGREGGVCGGGKDVEDVGEEEVEVGGEGAWKEVEEACVCLFDLYVGA